MLKNSKGILVGLVVGFLVIGIIEAIGHFVYPMPANFNFEDKVFLKEFIHQLPLPAFLFIILAHGVGAFIGSLVANKVSKSIGAIGLLVGLFFLSVTVLNLVLIPYHPIWFVITDILSTFIGAWLAFKLTLKNKK